MSYLYNSNKAQSKRVGIEEFGQSLFLQLNILSILLEQRKELGPLLVKVFDGYDDSTIYRLHWEGLEAISECCDDLRPLTVRRRSRGPGSQMPPAHDAPAGPTFNILMVISRPAGKEDIDPSLGSRSIMSIIRSIPENDRRNINFEIVRPGSWTAFESCIRERSQSW